MHKRKKKIILMDDEPLIQKVTGQMLKNLGYEVIITSEGDEAIKKYKDGLASNDPVDALIMDLSIIGGKGSEETLSELKKIDKNVKAIVSTGYAHDKQVIEYKEHGFAGALVKPYKLIELKKMMEEILQD